MVERLYTSVEKTSKMSGMVGISYQTDFLNLNKKAIFALQKMMNITETWKIGFTGKNVLIGVVDSGGLESNHREFKGKFVSIVLNVMC